MCWWCVQNMLQLLDVLVTVVPWKNTASSPQCYCFPVSSCLRSWLEQDTSCPTCRMSLNITDSHHVREDHQRENLDENLVPVAAAEGRPRLNQHNHFFHFDGELSTFDICCCCPNKQRGAAFCRRQFSLCFSWNSDCALLVFVRHHRVPGGSFARAQMCLWGFPELLRFLGRFSISAPFFLDLLWSAASVTAIYSLCAMLTSRMGNSCVFFCCHVVVNQQQSKRGKKALCDTV